VRSALILVLAGACVTARARIGVEDYAGKRGVSFAVMLGGSYALDERTEVTVQTGPMARSDQQPNGVATGGDYVRLPEPGTGWIGWRAGAMADWIQHGGTRFVGGEAALLALVHDSVNETYLGALTLHHRDAFAIGLQGQVGASWVGDPASSLAFGSGVGATIEYHTLWP
jgi:hypothetical protein